jgi:hypothetical protein
LVALTNTMNRIVILLSVPRVREPLHCDVEPSPVKSTSA